MGVSRAAVHRALERAETLDRARGDA